MVFVGIAAKLLTEAIKSVSVLDKIPDDFTLPDDDSPETVAEFRGVDCSLSFEPQPDRQLLELRRLRDRLISTPIGCAYELQLVRNY